MKDRDLELLQNMHEFGERAIRLLAGRDLPAFLGDESALYAVRYSVQVIGEAAGELSSETLDLMPLIPWRDIIAMRHRLTHGYAKVSDAVVRDTVILDLPALVNEVKRVLASRG